MRRVDEGAQVVRRAVEAGRRIGQRAVVPPAEAPAEIGDRHHLHDRDAERCEVRQALRGGRPGSALREGADVDLVEHLTVRRDALPVAVLPAVSRGIDEDGPAVGPGNLSPGGGVGERRAAVEAKRIAGAGTDSGHVGPRTSRLPRERARSRVRRSGPVRPTAPVRPRPGSWRRRRKLPRRGRTGESMGRAMSPRTLPGDVDEQYGPSHRTPSNPMRRRAFPERQGTSSARDCCPGATAEEPAYDHWFPPAADDAHGPPIGCSSGRRSGFGEAAGLAPYLSALGISHVYAAPVFAARPGSSHGYDVVDPTRLNPELGGETGFRAMAAAFRRHGLGLILDIVPNHMGIGGDSNRYWLDVLRWGPRQPLARWFDIDWNVADPRLRGKVLAPSPRRELSEGADEWARSSSGSIRSRAASPSGRTRRTSCRSVRGATGVILRAAGRVDLAAAAEALERGAVPTIQAGRRSAAACPRPRRHGGRRGCLPRRPDDPASLGPARRAHRAAVLASRQVHASRAKRSTTAASSPSATSRGFGSRTRQVFEATHALILALVEEGLVDGLRVDHIDGLRDPKAYLQRLRERAPRLGYLLVEKILAPDETLPAELGRRRHDRLRVRQSADRSPDRSRWRAASGAHLCGVHRAGRLPRRSRARGEARGDGRGAERRAPGADRAVARAVRRRSRPRTLGAALAETVAALDVYRTYADADGMAPEDRRRIADAVDAARGRRPDLDPDAFAFLQRALTPDLADALPARRDAVPGFPAAGAAVHRSGHGEGARGHRALSLQSG